MNGYNFGIVYKFRSSCLCRVTKEKTEGVPSGFWGRITIYQFSFFVFLLRIRMQTAAVTDTATTAPEAKIKIAVTVAGEPVAIPMKKGSESEALKAEIDRVLQEARDNGKLAELSIKYFGTDLTVAE